MTREHADALAALFDGERVDPAAVERALADPEAPAVLAGLAELRALAQADLGHPDEAFYTAMTPMLQGRGLRPWWRRFVQPALAASLLLLAGLTGYVLRPAAPPLRPSTAQSVPPVPAAPSAVGAPIGPGPQVAAAPARSPAGPLATGPHVPAGGPPPPSLRLRFSQWQTQGALAAGQPE